MTALPNKLKLANYSTHVVGKWDMGASTHSHLPTARGYDSSLVYFEHMNYYYRQTICPTGTSCDMNKYSEVVDMWDTNGPAAPNPNETYIEYLLRDRMDRVVADHNPATGPLYLQYNSHVTHWPLQVPKEWYDKFLWVEDDEPHCGGDIPHVWPGANSSVLSCRRQLLAMISLVDEIVGNLTASLKSRGWWNDTLVIFSPDNGGSIGTGENAGNNHPLRGGKYNAFEGGMRTAAFVSGGYLPPDVRGTILDAPIMIADWYATLLGLAGVDPTDDKARDAQPPLPPVDSLDMWPVLSGATSISPRTEIPYSPNVLLTFNQTSGHYWKLMTGNFQGNAGWQSPLYPNSTSSPSTDASSVSHDCGSGCLFDVAADETEHNDVALLHPDVVSSLQARLAELSTSFYSNSDTGVDLCPPGTPGDCMCWMAVNQYGGYLGPWQQ